ncbi:MAG TPA: hypothetical protein VHY79_02335 [Rhizomicrobium sp.]|jgi:hypothetical protein|nr:hypothetical protein [Rhizomicrobium sp.]
MKTAIPGLALALMLVSPVAADQTAAGGSFTGREAQAAVPAIAVPGNVHSVRAVLRYDLSTAGACRIWSDQPPELCVLLALNVIHMSEHPPKKL